MQTTFESILLKEGFSAPDAHACAEVFVRNSIDGIYTHGVNRFSKFIEYVRKGYIKPGAKPSLQHKFGAIEQWDGHYGPGPLNAIFCTGKVTELAAANGIGCLALANTNHWMRGGLYGWRAASKGFVMIAWTNTIGNMPAWGAKDARMGNNPLVIALPFHEQAILLDMAMSQYSFGAMELTALKNEKLTVPGGYTKDGVLTDDPSAILASRRPIPIGYWKGAGLSLLLDLLATILSGGLSTADITRTGIEYGCSQVFIAIDPKKLGNHSAITQVIENIIADYKASAPADEKRTITYPGERMLQVRHENETNGIPVIKKIWEEIVSL